MAALILPLIYDYCPYATALSRLIKPYPGTWSRKRERDPNSQTSGDEVPMDATTSHALAWMISNSEVPSSVDHALQAIAGTSFDMPNESLWECNVPEAIHSHLKGHLDYPRTMSMQHLKSFEDSDPSGFTSVLVYAQALNIMTVKRQEHEHTDFGSPSKNVITKIQRYEGLYTGSVVMCPLVGQTSNADLQCTNVVCIIINHHTSSLWDILVVPCAMGLDGNLSAEKLITWRRSCNLPSLL